MSQPEITILIPAYNEAGNIGETLNALTKIKYAAKVIVIDDCSTDNTASLAEQYGVKVIRLPRNIGKGGALNRGLEEVSCGIVAFLDADLKDTSREVEKLIRPVLENKADMTIAQFSSPRKKGGFGLVTNLARMGLKLMTGLTLHSPLSGQRVLKFEVLEAVHKKVASGFGVEVGLTIDVHRAGFRIKEIPVSMTHAETGRDIKGFMHRGKQFFDVLTVLINKWVNK